jgi:hypothetical protein
LPFKKQAQHAIRLMLHEVRVMVQRECHFWVSELSN